MDVTQELDHKIEVRTEDLQDQISAHGDRIEELELQTGRQWGRIDRRLDKTLETIEGFQNEISAMKIDGATRQDIERVDREHDGMKTQIFASIAALRDALGELHRQVPYNTDDLLRTLDELPVQLAEAQNAEAQARRIRDDARESLELATVNALMEGAEECAGKNAEERKQNTAIFMLTRTDVQAASKELADAEGHLLDATLELSRVQDLFAAVRTKARVVSATLEYLAGGSRQTNGK